MNSVINRNVIEQAFAEAAEIVNSGTPEERAGKVVPVRPVTELRQRLGLSREAFAARYHVPLETLESWERGAVHPDAVAGALLRLIAANPDGVAKVLAQGNRSEAAE